MSKAVKESKQLEKERIIRYRFLMNEYELIKQNQHPKFLRVTDFYKAHNIHKQTFLKYYHRFKQSGDDKALLPQKRGPKYKTRRPLPLIENKVLQLRLLGQNRYEIAHALKPILKKHTPSPAGVYNILSRHGVNRLSKPMKEAKRLIIKEKAGEMGHVDAHYLRQGIVRDYKKTLFLVAIIDDCSRVVGCELIKDIKSLTVMFAILRQLNILNDMYGIQFASIMTDNGAEFGKKGGKNLDKHPFERMLIELGIKHIYTRPYRPQTNGKIERFWRTIEEDLLEDSEFDSIEHFQEELNQYLVYYNHQRPHQGVLGIPPAEYLKSVEHIE